jgi:cytochrome c55X
MPRKLRRTLLALPWLAMAAAAAAQVAPGSERQRELVHMVRQDCGSCHGMRLTGGLGPSLQSERLKDWPLEALVATIHNGRPGTPMPGWAPMLSYEDTVWIARQLQSGFPQELR